MLIEQILEEPDRMRDFTFAFPDMLRKQGEGLGISFREWLRKNREQWLRDKSVLEIVQFVNDIPATIKSDELMEYGLSRKFISRIKLQCFSKFRSTPSKLDFLRALHGLYKSHMVLTQLEFGLMLNEVLTVDWEEYL